MIIGQADKERVTTAELQVIDLGSDLVSQQRRTAAAEHRAASAEARLQAEVAQNERLIAWARGIAVEAGDQVEAMRAASAEAAGHADAYLHALTELVHQLHQLHGEAAGSAICRHCGFAWPCPTITAVPSAA